MLERQRYAQAPSCSPVSVADKSQPSFIPARPPHPCAWLLDCSHVLAPGPGHGALCFLADLFTDGEFRDSPDCLLLPG